MLRRVLCTAIVGLLAMLTLGIASEAASGAPVGPGKAWALHWERQAKKNARHALTHTRCLGKKRLPWYLRYQIPRSNYATWREYGARIKRRAYSLGAYIRRTMRRMVNPPGTGARRWLPLARHEGWPRSSEAMLVRVIRRESGGRPGLIYGPHRGLLQIRYDHAPGRNLLKPRTNFAVGRQLFGRLGWGPWAATAW